MSDDTARPGGPAVGLGSHGGLSVVTVLCESCARWSFDPDAATQCPWFAHAGFETDQNPWRVVSLEQSHAANLPACGVGSQWVVCLKWKSRDDENARRREQRRERQRSQTLPLFDGL